MKSYYLLSWRLMVVCVLLASLASACTKKPQPPDEARKLDQTLEAVDVKRQAIEEEYKAMPLPQLVEQLEADSVAGIEPFNSLAYREIVSREPQVGRELASQIKAPDRTSLLTLLALREVNRDLYQSVDPQIKVEILTDALRTSEDFNMWGLPHLYWEDAAKAIIDQGELAIEPLRALLRDKRDAPVWGSEEVMEYERYKYRVCDYAWALLLEISGEKIEIPTDPAARDKLISAVLGE